MIDSKVEVYKYKPIVDGYGGSNLEGRKKALKSKLNLFVIKDLIRLTVN